MLEQLISHLKPRFGSTYPYIFAAFLYTRFPILINRTIKVKLFRAKKIKDFIDWETGDRILKEVPAQPVELVVLPYWDMQGTLQPGIKKQAVSNPLYLSLLNKCEVIAGNSLITRNDSVLFDDLFLSNAPRNDFHGYHWDIFLLTKHWAFLYRSRKYSSLETGIYLGGCCAYNYYHWIIEFVSKLQVIEAAGIDPDIPILVDDTLKKYKQLLDVLSVFTDRKIIFLEDGKRYRVKHLYWGNSFLWMTQHLKRGLQIIPEDAIIAKEPVMFLRNTVLEKLAPALSNAPLKKPDRLIYISKRVYTYRRFNEEEVIDLLVSMGFEVVYPEDLSFAEQVKLFQSARLIVGASGAWITNVLFANKGLTLLYFIGASNVTCFSPLGQYTGVRMEEFQVDLSDKKHVHSDFTINPERLKQVVSSIMKRQPVEN